MQFPSRPCALGVAFLLTSSLVAQTLKPRSEEPRKGPAVSKEPESIRLSVPAGTPLKVVVDKELRLRRVGQPVHGKTLEPIYSFDKLLIPAGSDVTGEVAEITGVSKKARTLAVLNADFSPPRHVKIELGEVALPDGRRLGIHDVVAPGENGVLQFVPAKEEKAGRMGKGKAAVTGKLTQAEADAKRQMGAIKGQITSSNKMHRLKRYAMEQSPYRPQYLDAGTGLGGVVPQSAAFGSEELTAAMVENIGQLPDSGGVVRAWLTTPLNSATAKRGDAVEARVSQPLLVDDKLYLPEGSRLKGVVLQVRPARRFARNGQLRIAFHEVAPPSGMEQQIQSTLEGVEATRGDNLTLDSEGGAQVKNSKTRYLKTGIAVMLAAASASPDSDAGRADTSGPAGPNALNGASGFKLIGTLVGVFARSRAVATGLGSYGAARSIYSHFLARGRDVHYPENMSLVLVLGPRENKAADSTKAMEGRQHATTAQARVPAS